LLKSTLAKINIKDHSLILVKCNYAKQFKLVKWTFLTI